MTQADTARDIAGTIIRRAMSRFLSFPMSFHIVLSAGRRQMREHRFLAVAQVALVGLREPESRRRTR
ncbi:hypothetical protein [Breoghania sp.]|uniref:hypothetical protein n=1 Tax=Breoghania sp. TaxID=2065378 RepID=UPI00261261BD|nr:hypothetical protein [Breoghania sp.]MDJ0933698.1 hypothetical protein [Breoghania sp.]